MKFKRRYPLVIVQDRLDPHKLGDFDLIQLLLDDVSEIFGFQGEAELFPVYEDTRKRGTYHFVGMLHSKNNWLKIKTVPIISNLILKGYVDRPVQIEDKESIEEAIDKRFGEDKSE